MQEVWIMDAQRFASSASTAHPFGRSLRTGRRVRAGKFLQACPNGDPGEPGRFGYAAQTSSSHGAGFSRCPRAACAIIQERPKDDKLCYNGLACWDLHRADRNTLIREMDRLFWRASLVWRPTPRCPLPRGEGGKKTTRTQTVRTRLGAGLTAGREHTPSPGLHGAALPPPRGVRVAGSSRGSYNGRIFSERLFLPPSVAGTGYTYGATADTGDSPAGAPQNARPLHAARR